MPNYTDDKFLLAAKVPDRMLLIDNKNMYAYTMKLDLQGPTGQGAPPQATVGKPWSFALGYPKGTKVLIEDGPEGMVYDSVTSKINWPAPVTKGFTEVLMSVIKPGKDEFYKEFKIWVK
jgi:hypothetical protein